VEGASDPHYIADPVVLQELPQLAGTAVHLVTGGPGWHRRIGDHVAADVDGQLGLGTKPDIRADPRGDPAHRVGKLISWDIDPGADQGVPTGRGVGAVDRVHAVGDPAGAPHVLPLHADRVLAGLLLSGLVQRRDHQGWSRNCSATNPRTTRIACSWSHTAWLSSRWGGIWRGVAGVFGDG
jgi:hypothetical protein